MADSLEAPSSGKKASRWPTFAKLVVGIGLLVALLAQADLATMLARLRSVDLFYLAVMFVLPHLMLAVSTLRWQILLRPLGLHVGFFRLFGLYMISTFFNNFLPTMVGGDVVRAYELGRDKNDHSSVTAATVLERVVGLAALISILPVALMSSIVTARFPAVWLFVPGVLLGAVVMTALLLFSRWDWLWQGSGRFHLPVRIARFVTGTRAAMHRVASSVPALAWAYALSLLFYVGAVGTVWAACKSLGFDVDWIYLAATVPLVLVAGMLPISLNGLGVTEIGFALFLQLVDVPLAEAAAVGLLMRARLIVTAAVGGILFLMYRRSSGEPAPSPGRTTSP